ncbi:MAG: 30S ribosomal protein S9 [Candidatus Caenarcaniphilales bacterium]|nr:30S ribosomal protein S9 [Candidatus Caenarcaniphilales bacterium]
MSTGRRKAAIARVLVKNGEGKVTVNGLSLQQYFGNSLRTEKKLAIALELTGNLGKKDIVVNVRGGGKVGQADAILLGIARSLADQKETNRKNLKSAGLLSRDSRVKESKKYGRKKARKRFQFSKR